MQKFIYIFLFLLSALVVKAQSSYSEQALQYAQEGNFEKAIELETENLKLIEKTKGKNTANYVTSLQNLAVYYSYLENYQLAIRLEAESLKFWEETLGKNNPYYVRTLERLASYHADTGNYNEAIRLLTEAVNLQGKNNLDDASSIMFLGALYSKLGNYPEAIRLGTEALKIIEKVLGMNNSYYLINLSSLAEYNSKLGNYPEAIRLETEALKIQEKNIGRYNRDYATSLRNLAIYNSFSYKFQEALEYGKEALKIQEKVLSNIHPDYAETLGTLANINLSFGNYREAISLASEALKIQEKVSGTTNPDYAFSLSRLALCNAFIENYQEAVRLETETLKIREEVLGKNHPDYATSLNYLAEYNSSLGNYEEAIRLGTEALKIQEVIMRKNHPDYAFSLSNLARYYMALEDLPNLNRTVLTLAKNLDTYLKSNFKYLPKIDRDHFWFTQIDWYKRVLPGLAFNYGNSEVLEIAFNASLLSKGILLNSEIEFDKFLTETGSSELAEKFNEIKDLRLQLNKLYEKPIAERWCDTDSLERVANNLERELMYESKEFGDYTRNLSITWQEVQKGLKDKDVAIEFVSFELDEDSTVYMAYVLKPDMEAPEMVKLFEEKDIIRYKDSSFYSKTEGTELFWGKLRPYLEGCENVYFAPDGLLHQIAIEHFPDFEDENTDASYEGLMEDFDSNEDNSKPRRLISDRYNMHRLSSTRQLAISNESNASGKVALYGGIDYDSDMETMEAESRKYTRDFNPYVVSLGSVAERATVGPLPGTLTEVINIDKALSDKGYSTSLYTDTEASEESFKCLSGTSPQILHIATHGYFWEKDEADEAAEHNRNLLFMSQLGDNTPRYVEDKALTRSWLFLAGANNALRGEEFKDGIENGLLTAQEISQMNLRGTDLVVLSACQTGLGDIGSDGVFGLQRGFKKAGVNSILMSLWNVDDKATQILMTEFYNNFLNGMTKEAALKEAQRKLREIPGYKDPYYWAGFILLDALN